MKLFTAIVALTSVVALVQSVALPKEMRDQLIAIANDCKGKSGASDEDLSNMLKNVPSDTRGSKCLLSCIMLTAHSLDSNGKLNKEGALALGMALAGNDPAKMKIAEEVVDSCIGIPLSDDA